MRQDEGKDACGIRLRLWILVLEIPKREGLDFFDSESGMK